MSPPCWLAVAVTLALLAAAWALFVIRRDGPAFATVILAVAAAGGALCVLDDRAYASSPLHRLEAPDYVDIEGTLLASPGREPGRDILLVRVGWVGEKGVTRTVRGNLRLTVPFTPGVRGRLDLHTGDRVRAAVRLSSGGDFRNFGGFSYNLYLKGRNIHRLAFTKSSLLVERPAGGAGRTLAAAVSRLRTALQADLEARFPSAAGTDISPAGAVLEALLLGEDGRMDPATVLSLQETGLYHLFAISGGHIAIITVLLFSLLRTLRMSPRASSAALIPFLLFYTLLVEGSPSVLRATFMTLALLVGRLLWKDVRALNTIAFSGFVLLAANPFSLFDAGFQLTYAATLAIILFYTPILGRLPRLPLKTSEMTALSLAALLGVLPILAASFNRVTLASLVLNYAAIPLVGLIMGTGYAFLPLALAFPALAGPPAAALKIMVGIFERLTHLLDGLPFLSYRVPTPHAWTLAGYYAALGLVLLRPRFRGQRALAAAAFAAFLTVLVTSPFSPSCDRLTLTMIDVGQGDSLLVEFPGRTRMLIDGGGFAASPFDVGEKVVSPVLWRKGIRRIDYLVLSHAHADHINGLVAVARNFRIGEFWEAAAPRDDPVHAALLRALPASTVRRRPVRGFRLRVAGVTVEALQAAADEAGADAANDRSLVLRIAAGPTAFLLPGDIGGAAERDLDRTAGDIRSAVLKVPHHGSASSSSEAFLDRVRPRAVLISVGEDNRFGFPASQILERFRRWGAEVFRTDLHGAVEVVADGGRVRIRTASGLSIRH